MAENLCDTSARLYYIDWLRVLVILSLIPFHSALTYSGLGDTYIASPLKDIRIIPFMLIVATLGNFFMTLLFFVSGIASYNALQTKGIKEYFFERRKKLLIPLGLGILTICPVQAYFKALYEGFAGSYFAFLPQFFSAKIVYYLGYAHLWFLLYLFVFSAICLPLFARWQSNPQLLQNISLFLGSGQRILIPMAYIIFAEITLRPFFQGPQTLIGDWANDVVYLSIFIFGFVFASDGKIQEQVNQYFKTAAWLVPLNLIVLFYTFWMWAIEESNKLYLTVLWVCAKGVYECAAIILLLGLGRKYLNKKGPLLSYLRRASFTYYLFHFVPISLFTYLVIKTNLNVYLKYILVVALSYLFIGVVYEVFVRRFRRLKNSGTQGFINEA